MPDIPTVVDRLVRYERAPVTLTKRFSTLAHNADLCPRLQQQVETLLRAYGKYHSITYDTQGLSDDGADIVISFPVADGERSRIGFQVKSFDDLEERHWLQRLKAQHSEATIRVHGLREYYIVLCTDHTRHVDKVRQVAAHFRDSSQAFVIEPQYAWTFLTFPEYRIEAHVKRALDGEDAVLRDAQNSLDLATPTAKLLAINACAMAVFAGGGTVTPHELINSTSLRTLYGEVISGIHEQITSGRAPYEPDDEDISRVLNSDVEALIASDLELLGDSLFAVDLQTGALRPNMDQLVSVVAVLADTIARFGTGPGHTVPYVADLLGIPLPTAPADWERSE